MQNEETLKDKIKLYVAFVLFLGVPIILIYVFARLLLPQEWLDFHLSAGWQIVGVMVWVSCVNWARDKERVKEKDAMQAKIDRLWKHSSKLEERMMRHSDWNMARCEKLIYDEKRAQFASELHSKNLERDSDDSIEDMLKAWKAIDERVEEVYPKKEIENFIK